MQTLKTVYWRCNLTACCCFQYRIVVCMSAVTDLRGERLSAVVILLAMIPLQGGANTNFLKGREREDTVTLQVSGSSCEF